MLEQLNTKDWEMAFHLARHNAALSYTRDSVIDVVGTDRDRDDERTSVYGVFKMDDGKFLYIEAGLLDHLPDWEQRSTVDVFITASLDGILRSCASVQDVIDQRKPSAQYFALAQHRAIALVVSGVLFLMCSF